MFWYIRKLLSKFLFISENLADLVLVVNNYRDHLKKIYGMEMFYGDETIKFLLEHTGSLIEILKQYENIYDISIPPEIEETMEDDEGTEIGNKINEEKNVFYAGTRRGNN
jgi:uncharacterized Fe-S radical SAM superfamily protein PflX